MKGLAQYITSYNILLLVFTYSISGTVNATNNQDWLINKRLPRIGGAMNVELNSPENIAYIL